jgi:hypothetical protein
MTEAEIKTIVGKLADIARVLQDADPDDKAEVFRQLGRRPVSRRMATLRETPWPRHRQIYPFRRWAGEAQACPARTARGGGHLRVGVRPRANRTVDLDGEVGTAPGLKALSAALQALAELLDLGSADAGMTTDLDPLIVTAPGIGIKKRTREGVARSQAPPRSWVCVPGTRTPMVSEGRLHQKAYPAHRS